MSPLLRAARPAALAALLLALGPGRAGAEPRTAVVEVFGAPECAACAEARAAAVTIAAENPGAVTWTEYAVGTPTPLASSAADDRSLEYGSPTLPTLFVDGAPVLPTGAGLEQDLRDAVAASLAPTSPLRLDGLFFFDPDSRIGSVIVDVTALEDLTEATHDEIRVLLVEDPVEWCCGPSGEGVWPRVARQFLDPLPLGVLLPGDQLSRQIDFPLNAAWDAERLTGLVMVQRVSDHAVVQAAEGRLAGTLPPLPYVPDDPSDVKLFPARPNPAPGLTRIAFYLPRDDYAQLRIMDVRGALVKELTAGNRTAGPHLLPWDGTDSEGRRRAAGIYLVVLETSTVRQAERVMLLR